MPTLKLRDAHVGDENAIRDVTLAAYQQYAALMPPQHWEFYKQNILSTLADVKPAQQIVAEQDGVLVGTVLLYPEGTAFSLPGRDLASLKWPEIRLLAVAPEARGQGIGAALVRDCARRAREMGSAVLTLHTTDMMSVAMRMYEKLGFVRDTALDFHPVPEVVIKAYRLELTDQPA